MCDDMYMSSIVFGDSSRYREMKGFGLTRIELETIAVKVKRSLVVSSRM
jgi:hypothetical protein